jgi:multidrug efflux pump subunit AcrA (membrane-fusion protein)
MPEVPSSSTPAADPRVRRYVLIALVVALVLAAWGILTRLSARISLERAAADAGVFTVATVHPSRGPGSDTLVLPGTVQAFYEAPIYARTSGYLRVWHTDIGTSVRKGQSLAEIDTP